MVSVFTPVILTRNTETIELKKEEWIVPKELKSGMEIIVPFMAGEKIDWQVITSLDYYR